MFEACRLTAYGVGRSCYVYEMRIDGVVRYIGRGRGNRIKNHWYAAKRYLAESKAPRHAGFYQRLAAVLRTDATVEFTKIVEGLSLEDAAAREAKEVEGYPSGQLWNGIFPRRPKLADDVLRAKLSRAQKAKWERQEYRDKMRDVRSTPEVRQRIQDAARARSATPEWRANNAKARAKADACDPAKHAAATKEAMADPALRALLSEKAKARATRDRAALLVRAAKGRETRAKNRRAAICSKQ